ncbi:hypothetical protein EUGRSUZ_E02452 [Eucalyptus grandis]|uniref:Uncharacterized protein n=2 Tax=Eucalyptus grandis TaxID=71139 RepID=A0A059C6P0_EUCGR|nr:hypothetical protein EUGRSUZ_E02452 [Eucalyptus grandis]
MLYICAGSVAFPFFLYLSVKLNFLTYTESSLILYTCFTMSYSLYLLLFTENRLSFLVGGQVMVVVSLGRAQIY